MKLPLHIATYFPGLELRNRMPVGKSNVAEIHTWNVAIVDADNKVIFHVMNTEGAMEAAKRFIEHENAPYEKRIAVEREVWLFARNECPN